jgi:hypothetical protein
MPPKKTAKQEPLFSMSNTNGTVPFPGQWRDKVVANPDKKAGDLTKAELATLQLVSAIVSRNGTISHKGLTNVKKLARKILEDR